VSTLERRYRRILAVLPKAYRADRSEEMLTALLDGAQPGQTRPKLGDVLSLGTLAVRLRLGAPGASAGGQLTVDVSRRVIIIGLMVWTLFGATTFAALGIVSVYGMGPQLYGEELVAITLAVALLFGWRLAGRVLGAANLLLIVHSLLAFGHVPMQSTALIASVCLQIAISLAVFPVFHRETPRLSGRWRWLALWVVPMAVLCAISAAITIQWGPAETLWSTTYAIAAVAAAAYAIQQFKVSPIWPAALALGSFPAVLCAAEQTVYPYRLPAGLALDLAVGAEVVLIATALASLAYWHRRRLAVA
jgi:hypothetical protein